MEAGQRASISSSFSFPSVKLGCALRRAASLGLAEAVRMILSSARVDIDAVGNVRVGKLEAVTRLVDRDRLMERLNEREMRER